MENTPLETAAIEFVRATQKAIASQGDAADERLKIDAWEKLVVEVSRKTNTP